jgi:hypothetical protein
VVIEEFLARRGGELHRHRRRRLTVLPMASSQDHKRIGEGDTGPNTGGMGAYSPAPVVDERYTSVSWTRSSPTLAGMAAEGNRYTGLSLRRSDDRCHGAPRVIEFNCRFGDPETQPIMLRLRSGPGGAVRGRHRRRPGPGSTRLGPAPCHGCGAGRRGYPGATHARDSHRAARRGGGRRCKGLPRRHGAGDADKRKRRRSSPAAVACCARRPWARTLPTRTERCYAGVEPYPLRGRAVPPRHWLARPRPL